MNRKKESKLVNVRITGISAAIKAGQDNWGDKSCHPWYESCIGKTFQVVERERDYFLAATGGCGQHVGYSCAGNRTIVKGDAEVVDSN